MIDGLRLDRLEALMAARGYGPGELALYSGLSYDYVYKIRKGQAPNIAAVQVQKLAAALKTSTDYLLGLTDELRPPAEVTGASALPAEVADLAARLGALPDALRARLLPVLAGLVALFSADGLDGLSERERLLLTSYAQLPETDQETVLEVAEQMVAAQRATDVSSTGVRRAS